MQNLIKAKQNLILVSHPEIFKSLVREGMFKFILLFGYEISLSDHLAEQIRQS